MRILGFFVKLCPVGSLSEDAMREGAPGKDFFSETATDWSEDVSAGNIRLVGASRFVDLHFSVVTKGGNSMVIRLWEVLRDSLLRHFVSYDWVWMWLLRRTFSTEAMWQRPSIF